MLFVLDWMVLASLADVVAGTTASWLLAASRPLPAPWWAAVALAAGLYNRRLLRRPRSLALVLVANLPPVAAALAGPAIWQAAAGPWSPGALPGIVDVAFLWPLAAYVLCRPPDKREFAGWWEGGAVVVLLVALGGSAGDRVSGFRLASAILYLAAGLARLALGLARNSRPAPGDGRHPLLPLALLVAGGAVGLGFFLALPAAAHLCRETLALLWQALVLLGRGLAYLIDLLGLNRLLVALADRLLPYNVGWVGITFWPSPWQDFPPFMWNLTRTGGPAPIKAVHWRGIVWFSSLAERGRR